MIKIHRFLEPFSYLGRYVLERFQTLGQWFLCVFETLRQGPRVQGWGRSLVRTFGKTVFFSMGLVFVTAFFAGMVLALQIYTHFAYLGDVALSQAPTLIAFAMIRELGPVLGGLMVCARLGSSMASEVSTMKVSEQFEALVTLSKAPLGYVIFPKILACTLGVPILLLCSILGGIAGGGIMAVIKFHVSQGLYLWRTFDTFCLRDLYIVGLKGAVFGFLISSVSCYQGIRATHGALGVGVSTMGAVVQSCVLVLLVNYLISSFLFGA